MKKTFLIATIWGMTIMVASCGYSSSSDYECSSDYVWYSTEPEDNEYSNHQKTDYVRCPLCNGTGVFYMVPGNYSSGQICGACNGTGQCDETTATQIKQMYDDINAMASGGYTNGGGYYDSETQNSSQIETEIVMHEANIAQMEGSLEYLDGISRMQMEQQIINEQYEIRRLKNLLGYQ